MLVFMLLFMSVVPRLIVFFVMPPPIVLQTMHHLLSESLQRRRPIHPEPILIVNPMHHPSQPDPIRIIRVDFHPVRPRHPFQKSIIIDDEGSRLSLALPSLAFPLGGPRFLPPDPFLPVEVQLRPTPRPRRIDRPSRADDPRPDLPPDRFPALAIIGQMIVFPRFDEKGKLVRDRVGTMGVNVEGTVRLGRVSFSSSGLVRPGFSVFARFRTSAVGLSGDEMSMIIEVSIERSGPPELTSN